jgi:hypothetical protein
MSDQQEVDYGGAYLGFRSKDIRLDPAPAVRDELILMVKAKCVGDGHKLMEDGELRPVRQLKIVAAWRPGEKPPSSDDQPSLFEEAAEAEAAAEEAEADDGV